jgi:hypothetical protein
MALRKEVAMAKGSIMLQIAVEQTFAGPVNDLPEVWTVVLAGLDSQHTVVREIASEKNHGLAVMAAQNNVIVPAIDNSQDVATDVWLAFNDLQRPPLILHGPSHVPSPPVDGAALVLLRVRDFGMTVDERLRMATQRRIGSHVYLDETIA